MTRTLRLALVGITCAAALAIAAVATRVLAQHPATAAPAAQAGTGGAAGTMLLTIFLKHDQSRPLAELNAQLDKQGWREKFPPQGVEVVSWYVMMGIGQVVTLRFPAEKLREVNRVVEDTGWGAYRTEFYPTYDYKSVWEAQRKDKR
jgi:hypothetical protein